MSHYFQASARQIVFVFGLLFTAGTYLFGKETTVNAKPVHFTAGPTVEEDASESFPYLSNDIHSHHRFGGKEVEDLAGRHEFPSGESTETSLQYAWLVRFNTWYQGIHGYLSLVVCSFGICSNIINIIVLTRPIMISPTNILLTIVACTDILTMISYLPYAVYFYCYSVLEKGKGHSRSWIVFMIFHNKFVITCHTSAMWLTVLLAVFRYVVVSKPHFFLSQGARRKGRRRSTLTPYWWRVVKLSVLGVLGATVFFCAPFYVLHKPVSLDEERDQAHVTSGQVVPYAGYAGVGSAASDYVSRFNIIHGEEFFINKSRKSVTTVDEWKNKNKNHLLKQESRNFTPLFIIDNYSIPLGLNNVRSLLLDEVYFQHSPVPPEKQRKLGYWIAVNDFIPDEVMAFNFWLFGVLLKLAPCCLLSILSFLLVKTMRRANEKRKRLKRQQQEIKQRQQSTLESTLENKKNNYFCTSSTCCNCYCCCHNKWCYCCCGFSCVGQNHKNQNYCSVVEDKQIQCTSQSPKAAPNDSIQKQFHTPPFEQKRKLQGDYLLSQSTLNIKSHSLLDLPAPKEQVLTNSYDNLINRSSFGRSQRNLLRASKEASRRNLFRRSGKFRSGSPKIDEGAKLAVVVELHPGIQVDAASRSSNELASDKLSVMKATSLSKLSSSSLAVPTTFCQIDSNRASSSLTSLRMQRSTSLLASHALSVASLSLPARTMEVPRSPKAAHPPTTDTNDKNRSLSVNFSLRPSPSTMTVGSANYHISSSASSVPSSPEVDCNRTTAMLVAVVLTFVATELPPGVIALWSGFDSKIFDDIYVPLGDVWDILVLVNSSVNFVLYCTMSRQFRRTFNKMFAATKKNFLLRLGLKQQDENRPNVSFHG